MRPPQGFFICPYADSDLQYIRGQELPVKCARWISLSRNAIKGELSKDEINFFINGFTSGEITDYQASAWAMAVVLNGMTLRETTDLTLAIAHSGAMLDLSDVVDIAVDKHSSGGVGDKTTLVVLPVVAACGLPVGKMSGRGLGFSGGTIDKLGIHSRLSALI